MNSADAISRVEELLLHKGRLLKKYIRVIIISEHISDNVVAIASAIQAYSIPRGRNMFIRHTVADMRTICSRNTVSEFFMI